ncbi:NAD(P)-binding protein [Basidiobolus meristosporus CBS 931.73]|uniref:3-dehydrosphinganine reductase n=1 Tax=Basidiobolus meristosporus CBS 931.73 TaxID=1314790 RepID=A0A1Y1Y6B3_9FUNG|nr:NAD(P)-binding protein [Basidiobolus meristosporus CBS 931.73]|eukprot:ORX93557.1 NAD(P)-binding protein [Basidiobolus meristosporus CBS 931.73]
MSWLIFLAIVSFLGLYLYTPLYNIVWAKKFNPEGKHCYITGGSTGLGKSLAVEMAKRGAHVTIVARKKEALETAVAEIKRARKTQSQVINYISADVSVKEEAQRALEEAIELQQGLVPEYVFPCAGLAMPGLFIDQGVETFERTMQLNYFGALYTVHAAVKRMIEQNIKGKILLVSSTAGLLAFVGYASYSPTKFAVRGLAEVLRNELAMYDIDVHCYFPGNMDTPGLKTENETKPQITKQIEGEDSAISPDAAAQALVQAISENHCFISSDLIGNLARCANKGFVPSNNVLIDLGLSIVSLVAAPIIRIFVDYEVISYGRKLKKN